VGTFPQIQKVLDRGVGPFHKMIVLTRRGEGARSVGGVKKGWRRDWTRTSPPTPGARGNGPRRVVEGEEFWLMRFKGISFGAVAFGQGKKGRGVALPNL